jgi:hypothetical protein
MNILRIDDLRSIKILVKVCTDIHVEGQYKLMGKALKVVPLTGGWPCQRCRTGTNRGAGFLIYF